MWVRSEYAGELSVLLTWASALLPWSVSLSGQEGITFIVVRFPLFAFQFLFGVRIRGGEVPFLPVYEAPAFPQGTGVAEAYTVWLAGGVVYFLAFALSLVYYAADEDFETTLRDRVHARADPVRLLGGLLTVGGLVLAASTVMLWQAYLGTTLPLGSLFMLGFGLLLLRVERT